MLSYQDKKYISHYLSEARSNQGLIQAYYSEITRFTNPFSVLWDTHGNKTVVSNPVDGVIINSYQYLVNFLMNTMLSRGSGFIKATIDEETYRRINEESDIINTIDIKSLNEQLDTHGDYIFKHLNNSNFYQEVSKCLTEAVNLGTACVKIREHASTSEPISFEYVPVGHILFTEDTAGSPNVVFREYRNINALDIEDYFEGAKLPSNMNKDDYAKTYTLLESVIPDGAGGYRHLLTTDSMEHVFFDRMISYNPLIVFRWNVQHTTTYGVGVGFSTLYEFRQLEELRALRVESAKLINRPALVYTGEVELFGKIEYGMGKISYGGDQGNDVRPINQIGRVLEIDQDIQRTEDNIRRAYLAEPIGGIHDTTVRTATEVQIRMNEFRQRFATTSEMLNEELLKTVFVSMINMFMARDVIEFVDDAGDPIEDNIINITNITYVNELSKAGNEEKINKLLRYKEIGQFLLSPMQSEFSMHGSETMEEIGELLDVPQRLTTNSEELDEIRMAEMQMQMQQRAMEQGTMQGGEQGGEQPLE